MVQGIQHDPSILQGSQCCRSRRPLPNATWVELNATLAKNAKAAKDLGDFKKYAAKIPTAYINSLNPLFALYQDYSILTIGQNDVYNGSLTCNIISSQT
ncbi:hypothetical protein AXG93_2230s1000 [Marchantia polymorpha subsp. ruderalis]|uniref:Uncharacterized protein n=1 Tax=Marchantia polymorpha subsp. ruderalis TaxID=1480154 RepID=A0A176W0P4_MARPO|nr:hypothetical protein AXG93_2230s1000 [Marchantia polymorpha subsp. ruderalis]